MAVLSVSKIPKLNTLVLRQTEGREFFIASTDVVVISVPSLANILKYLLDTGYLSPRVLEGVLEEYNTDKGAVAYDSEA